MPDTFWHFLFCGMIDATFKLNLKMKKRALFTIVLLSTFMIFSCKKENKSGADLGGIMGNNEQNAGVLIDAYNQYLGVDANRIDYIKNTQEYANNVQAVLDGERTFAIGGAAILNRFNKWEKLPDVFGDKKDDLQAKIDQNDATFKQLHEKVEELQMYMKAEDYKDDAAKKGNELVSSIHTLAADYYKISGDLIKEFRPLVNEAEEITLKNDPLKDHIIAMKDVMLKMGDALDEIDQQYGVENHDNTEIQKSYDAISEGLTKVKELTIADDVVENTYAAKTYKNSFESAVDDYLAQLRKTMRDAETENEVNDSNYTRLEDIYNRMIGAYNNFING